MFCCLDNNYSHNELVVLCKLITKPHRLNDLEGRSFIHHRLEAESPDSQGSSLDEVSVLPWPLAMPLSDPFLMCAKEWVWEGMKEVNGASSFKNSSLPNQTCFPLV